MNNFITSLGLCNMVKQFRPTAQHRTLMNAVRRTYRVNVCQSNGVQSLPMSDVQRPLPMSDGTAMPSGTATMVFPQDTIYVNLDLDTNDDYVYEVKFIDSYEREQPMYLLTQAQAIELASHYKRFHRELIKNIIAERDKLIEQNTRLLQERTQLLEQQNVILLEDKSKYDNLVNANGTYTATEVGMDVGMNVFKFNEFLGEKKIQRREGNKWVLNPTYADKGYGVNRVAVFTHSNGEKETVSYLVWTNKGRDFIINELFTKK